MNIESEREYCLKKPEVTEGFPFGEDTLVFKVAGKIFLLAGLDEVPLRINVKCDPEKTVELREKYDSVLPGYHMNKTHWNTIIIDDSFLRNELYEWINDSYLLVVETLPKKEKEKIKKLIGEM
ncbi:MAG: MmcQ/YjbR family DNA-binding protein [Ignavibacteriales bacterium]|nr:MAG: MmcQ/YjbR family DNA-binding protein [Ignavibacteriales bacterium]